MHGRNALIAVSLSTLIGLLYYFDIRLTSKLPMSDSNTANDEVPGLELRLSQISKNPPSLLVTLKNNHPSSAFTVLKWNTALDPQAANLGLFKIVDGETGETIPTDGLKVSRLMPPGEEDLVTIAPGTEEAHEVVMNKPWLPERRPAMYKVSISGKFSGLWDKYGGDVQMSDRGAYLDSPFSGRSFKSNEVMMRVE